MQSCMLVFLAEHLWKLSNVVGDKNKVYCPQKVRYRKIEYCVPQKTDHAPELSWLNAEKNSQFKCTRSSRSSDQPQAYASKFLAGIAQQRIDQLIRSMRARVREGVRRTHPLLIDFVELTRALHLNFEMMLLPLLLLKIDLKSVKPIS